MPAKEIPKDLHSRQLLWRKHCRRWQHSKISCRQLRTSCCHYRFVLAKCRIHFPTTRLSIFRNCSRFWKIQIRSLYHDWVLWPSERWQPRCCEFSFMINDLSNNWFVTRSKFYRQSLDTASIQSSESFGMSEIPGELNGAITVGWRSLCWNFEV